MKTILGHFSKLDTWLIDFANWVYKLLANLEFLKVTFQASAFRQTDEMKGSFCFLLALLLD